MKINEILPNINNENYSVEFKARLLTGLDKQGNDNELKWLKKIVAFANTQGGTLFVGVNDKTHEIEPLNHSDIDETAKLLYQKVEERIEPDISLRIKEISLGKAYKDQYLLRIDVEKSERTPVYVHANGIPVCYIRQFGRVKTATPEQIAQLVVKSTRIAYDSVLTDEIYKEKDYQKLIAKYEETNPGKKLDDKTLISFGFMNNEKRLFKGALLFKDNCEDLITLAKCSVYPGFDKGGNVVSASQSYQGCLISVIYEVVDFVKNHSTIGYKKTNDSRIDLSSYPERALFEGVVNAFAHRNYFIFGTEIQFDVFKDRLEITSPGSLLGGKNLEQEKQISQIMPKRRNELICKILESLHMMEAKGTGFDKIVEDYRQAKESQKPFVSCNDDYFTLTLPDLTFQKGVLGEGNPYPEIHLLREIASSYDERILSCCYLKERTITEIASFLQISSSSHLRNDILEKLVEEGYLFKTQKGKAFFYLTNRAKLEKENAI